MKIRLTALMLLAVTAMFVFSGCSLQMKTPDELMSPPKIAGGYQNLQDSFEAVAGEDVELETPMNGEHKSAFIIDDFDSDGNEDAMVFYSEKGKKSTVNIGIFNKDKDSDKWDYIKSVKGLGNSVDTVVLDDMNGDGLKEVVVGWNLLNLSKQLSIYEPSTLDSSNYFYEMGSFQYSLFDMIDIDSDSHKELFFVNLENTNNVQSASAQAAKISKDGKKVESVGKTALDGNVSGYSKIYTDKTDGKVTVLVDAAKGEHDMITELIVWDSASSNLSAPLFDTQKQINSATWRNSRTYVTDIDADGHLEIPVGVKIPGSSNVVSGEVQEDELCYIRWCDFEDSKLKAKRYNLYNYSEGYSLEIPSSWVGRITVSSLDSQWYFYRWNASAKEHMGEMLFSVVSHTVGAGGIEGYSNLTEYNGKSYEYIITAQGKKFGITDDSIKKGFSVITDRQGENTK